MDRNMLDVGRAIDDGPYTLMQKLVVVLAALAIVMDGFDGQLIGFAIPAIMKEWGIARGAFSPAVAAGLVGMAIGSASAGLCADRYGRRLAIVGSVLLFGAATCAIGFAKDVGDIAILRLIAGLGIGGALPSATTMSAEFTPARRRTMAVTVTIVCVPLGGMLAGLYSSVVLSASGWRGLFFIGGALPLVLGVLLLLALPESPRFLVRRPARWEELAKLMARMERPTAQHTVFSDPGEQQSERRGGFGGLFAQGKARDTLAIWCAFFMCLLAVYSAFSWLPSMLVAAGLDVSLAASGLTAYNLGGVVGALGCAVAITRFGSRWPLALCCAGGAASALLLQSVDVGERTGLLIFGLGVHGMCVNAVQSTMYAVCAFIYPTGMRATGTAGALAFGRFGAVFSAFIGAAVITAGGASAYLAMLSLAMLGVLAALLLVRGHIPPRPA